MGVEYRRPNDEKGMALLCVNILSVAGNIGIISISCLHEKTSRQKKTGAGERFQYSGQAAFYLHPGNVYLVRGELEGDPLGGVREGTGHRALITVSPRQRSLSCSIDHHDRED